MPVERWILVGVKDAATETTLRKTIVQAKRQTTRVSNAEECAKLVQRREFLAAFFDRAFWRDFSRKNSFPTPTYTTLLVDSNQIQHAIDLQNNGKIHDWLTIPFYPPSIASILSRAKLFLRQATELEAIKAIAASNIRNDAMLLCTGSWAQAATRWINQVKNGDSPLLLAGEPGCGKRLFARLLHYSSPRASAPFVTVQCDHTNAEELEREIFGEIPPRDRPMKAASRRSKFSLAANGTVVFDKVEHLSRRLQQRIARVIESRRFSPIGGGEMLNLDVRLIFTVQERTSFSSLTKLLHRDLARILKRSMLRIPPLRERASDLPLIVRSALEKIKRERGVRPTGITDKAMEILAEYSWPGNVRELEGVLWAASVLAGRGTIDPHTLKPFLSNGNGSTPKEDLSLEAAIEEKLHSFFERFPLDHLKDLHPMMMERLERPLFKLILKHTDGNQVRASQLLGINRNTLRRKLATYGISLS